MINHFHYTGKYGDAAHSIWILNEIYLTKLLLSHYDYHYIIKELAEEFKGQFNCSGEHTEKDITFSVSVEKEVT